MQLEDLDFRPLPSDPDELTPELALSACGCADLDAVFRNIFVSIARHKAAVLEPVASAAVNAKTSPAPQHTPAPELVQESA